jgi:hypothetical protein
MRFEKLVIDRLAMPYAIGTLGSGPAASVVCATEDHGPTVVADPPYTRARPLAPGPGGCMALLTDPERPGDLYAIMGCFVGYRFQGAGIYRIRDGSAHRLLDLPFAHRIGIVRREGSRYLLAASIAADKRDAADWSQPGAVHAAGLGAPDSPLTLVPVLEGIHKNHGFLVTPFEGRRSVLIGCAEGLLAMDLESSDSEWPVRPVLPQEVSEIAVADLDGDGRDELVTIEPFHGSALRAYRQTPGGWSVFWEAEISFGHCVLAGAFAGRGSVLVSNRDGSRDLLLFQFSAEAPSRPTRIVVEAGAAAANMLVLTVEGTDRIVSANQAAGEIALYTPLGG